MMSAPEKNLSPDRAIIQAHLEWIVRDWHELEQKLWLEIRSLIPGQQHSTQIGKFRPTELDLAVDWAISLNSKDRNVYAVINPIRDNCNGPAKDSDIVAAKHLWADCDDETAARNVHGFVGPKWTAAVTTGTTPTVRPHTYWKLEEWCLNLDAWHEIQRSIAATFQSDRSVVNPSRIMRLAGTINWPGEKKRAKGYVTELVTLRTEYEDDRAPISFERAMRVWPKISTNIAAASAGGFALDTGPESLDRERAAIAAMDGQEWHNNVVRLVGSYVSKGLSDGEIHALTDSLTTAGYTSDQTRAEVQKAIDGARAKGWTPDGGAKPRTEDVAPINEDEIQPFPFRPWREIDLAAIPRTEFLYNSFYARGYTSVTLAPPKVGKSLLGLIEAIDMATGRGSISGYQQEPLKVVYFNAEDDQHEINKRVAAILTHYNIPQSEIVNRLFATSGVEMDDAYMVGGQEGIINEYFFTSVEKFIASVNADVLTFDPLQDMSRSPETNEVFRLVGQRLRRLASTRQVAIGLTHHTRKMAPGVTPSMDDMRGGSALRGTSRFNRLLVAMTEEEAAKAAIENHRHFFRIGDVESNLAPPSAQINQWFEKVSVEAPNGQSVGVVSPWKWPDAFDGVQKTDSLRVRAEIDGRTTPPRLDVRASDWAGEIIISVLGLNPTDKSHRSKAKNILSKWIETDVLRVAEERDKRTGRDVNVVVCGANDPSVEGAG